MAAARGGRRRGARQRGAHRGGRRHVFAERQLWGKARRPLEQTAHTATLPGRVRRHALRRLAFIARLEGDEVRGGEYERQAAMID